MVLKYILNIVNNEYDFEFQIKNFINIRIVIFKFCCLINSKDVFLLFREIYILVFFLKFVKLFKKGKF